LADSRKTVRLKRSRSRAIQLFKKAVRLVLGRAVELASMAKSKQFRFGRAQN
jgi:hypothetical protein